ncbi:MAG: DUF2461 domain-containing protein [Myxococcaceae bacterium]|nr:DUF2461 domain-containing protein [Myxococcaceae bacterium]
MTFTGFPKEGVGFFRELSLRQDRDWFKANKARYQALWEAPLKALLDDVQPRLAKVYRGLPLEKPKAFRIYRDVRFSKDKSPFKTNVAGVITGKGGIEVGAPAALYVHLGLTEEAGVGHWMLSPEQLASLRRVLVDPKAGAELRRKVAALEARGFTADAMEKLKRVPKGFDPEHPSAELLKLKGLGLLFPKIPPKVRFGAGLADWLVDRSTEAAPLVLWLQARL